MKLYVGTYAKYNSGDISGAWLDLNAYWKRFGASEIHTWTYWTEA